MKIICDCGAKYSFEVTPEMAARPVQFVCQLCGLDSSARVNRMIQQELSAAASAVAQPALPVAALVASAPAPAPARVPLTSAAPAPPAPAAPKRVAIARSASHAEPTAAVAADAPAAEEVCRKHSQAAFERCYVCQKPICPQCMALFGYVCSPLCKAKADSHGIDVPVFAGQKSVVDAKRIRHTAGIAGAVGVLAVLVVGVWIWYTWFGSVPGPVFSVRFDQPAEAGQSRLCGKNQIVFLRNGTLSRYDLKTKKEVWSSQLIDPQQIKDSVAAELKSMRAIVDRHNNRDEEHEMKMPSAEEIAHWTERAAFASLQLHVVGQNVWISSPGKLVRHDWNDGKPAQEIPLAESSERLTGQRDELVLMKENESGQRIITHINLASGESKVEEIGEPVKALAAGAGAGKSGTNSAASIRRSTVRATGTPAGVPTTGANQSLDPAKVAEQAQHMSLPGRIALPAVLVNSMNQERIQAELNDPSGNRRHAAIDFEFADRFQFIPSPNGHLEFSVRLLESKVTVRKAMKDAPAKSALDGNLTVTKTTEVANEILNEMQRNRGGDTVTEDESRYQVTVRRPVAKEIPDWSGEVIGPPAVFPLKTVDVVTGGKTVIVLDKSNKKLWQSTLTYTINGSSGSGDEDAPYGQGPCVEHGNTLYIFDQAVLTAFDLATGDVRWRLPSVGVMGLFFDDQGMVYVNTTSGSPDQVKFSRQIDISRPTGSVILKVDPKAGKILWRNAAGGYISYLSGKFIYVVTSHDADDEADSPIQLPMATPSHVMIRRLNPSNGNVMWEHFQKRAPLDVHFDGNTIELVFKKEVQVLKFLSL
jgi:outer membrane protein assembly factor BamB